MDLGVDERHGPVQTARKRRTTDGFTPHISPRRSDAHQGPVLTDPVLRRFRRPFEVFIEVDP